MSSSALSRRQKKPTPFRRIEAAPEPEEAPKTNGTPMPHLYLIESVIVLKEYRFHCADCEAAHLSSVHPVGQGKLVKAVNPRQWSRYGWEITP